MPPPFFVLKNEGKTPCPPPTLTNYFIAHTCTCTVLCTHACLHFRENGSIRKQLPAVGSTDFAKVNGFSCIDILLHQKLPRFARAHHLSPT